MIEKYKEILIILYLNVHIQYKSYQMIKFHGGEAIFFIFFH